MITTCSDLKESLSITNDGKNYFKEFEMRAKNVSTEVYAINTAAEAHSVISNIIKELGAKKIVAVPSPHLDKLLILDFLKNTGIEIYTDRAGIAENAETADIGMSGVEFGIAECGTVCQEAFSIESRLVSSLPPLHIAFLERKKIVPQIEDAIDVISKSFKAGYVSWITGPSRTADIERVLTIGVHGPSRLVIIAVDEKADGGIE